LDLDKFSKPVNITKTKLSVIFSNNFRDSKKGRYFMPLYDDRFPFLDNFKVKYIYCSKFLEKNNASGNHYHLIKQEILIPLSGSYEFHLENIQSKEKEVLKFSSDDNVSIYIPTKISHKVVSLDDTGVLLVLANTHSDLSDEIEYFVD
jgi:dTDP-4-dehydrorhamnose 3,5-epimerase-like enzyme